MKWIAKPGLIIGLLLIGIIAFVVNKYGYLGQSWQNAPKSEKLVSIEPLALTTTDTNLDFLKLPPKFAINYYAENVPGARSIAVGGNNLVFIGSRPEGTVYALRDNDQDGRADIRYIVASGLNNPNGVAYRDGTLYVAEIGRLIKFTDIDSRYDDSPKYEIVSDALPDKTHHGWRYIKFGPDGRLYIGIGFPCNVCEDENTYGRISSIDITNPSASFETYATGIRNTVGFDWNPVDKTMWFTDNGRDNMGDDAPPDELNRAPVKGLHFGFPYCHGESIRDPEFGRSKDCTSYTRPAVELDPHVAALGILFYQGDMLPAEYKNQPLIAEHGSWNRTVPIGYRLMKVTVNGDDASEYQEFISGWLGGSGDASGRPVDIAELSDGSLLVTDDLQDAVYRITYNQ
jgi:glucose/arabinose dehydrogenase